MKPVLAYLTTKDKREAKKLGAELVEKKIAACVNILPAMESLYVWKGKREEAKECVLIAKTFSHKKQALIAQVKKSHSYECPCILFFDIKGGNPNFLKWLADCVK